ncbi:MAG TPA: type II toxin-antitoxin system VapC family toxin, partial [archaeon]|nr:type II toxin-antitoxin system VapC family toxin [archaeon]
MEKTKEAYIDSNVFIYAAIQEKGIGEASIRILKDIISGKLNAFTSVLTFDEVFWKIKKLASAADALERTHDLLIFPNLTFLDVKLETIATAHKIIKQFGLDPRDS